MRPFVCKLFGVQGHLSAADVTEQRGVADGEVAERKSLRRTCPCGFFFLWFARSDGQRHFSWCDIGVPSLTATAMIVSVDGYRWTAFITRFKGGCLPPWRFLC